MPISAAATSLEMARDRPATVAIDEPRPAIICATKPPKEWPTTAGRRCRRSITVM